MFCFFFVTDDVTFGSDVEQFNGKSKGGSKRADKGKEKMKSGGQNLTTSTSQKDNWVFRSIERKCFIQVKLDFKQFPSVAHP